MKSHVFLFALVLFTACSVDDDIQQSSTTPDPTTPSSNLIDPALVDYVQRFEQEAARRGFNVDVKALGITVRLVDIPEDHVAGRCYYNSNFPNRVQIDTPTFNAMSDLMREYVVFHELGHCILARGHTEATYANGICRSIMASGTGSCRVHYTNQTRPTFVAELFNNH